MAGESTASAAPSPPTRSRAEDSPEQAADRVHASPVPLAADNGLESDSRVVSSPAPATTVAPAGLT
eukprot:678262-Prorocentrum_lima.AAC.1